MKYWRERELADFNAGFRDFIAELRDFVDQNQVKIDEISLIAHWLCLVISINHMNPRN